jgi:mRNA-degrading endonuclease RelE of RelBE toxin-antitoxin system
MSFSIIPTPNFERELKKIAKKYPSLKADLLQLQKNLLENPTQGDEVFKNCYKVRFAIKSKGRGKSGGGRLITYVKIQRESIYLLSIYDKSEKETIPDEMIRYLLRDIP